MLKMTTEIPSASRKTSSITAATAELKRKSTRKPTPITLKEGWNHVKLTLPMTVPVRGWSSHQWIGTFIPLLGTTARPREVPGLEYASDPR